MATSPPKINKMRDLTERNKVLKMQLTEMVKRNDLLEQRQIREGCGRCKKYKEALDFYASLENYLPRGNFKPFTVVGNDRGTRAREVIKHA